MLTVSAFAIYPEKLGNPPDLFPTKRPFAVTVENEQVKKVFWAQFVAMAGLVLARVQDPATAQQILGIISGVG